MFGLGRAGGLGSSEARGGSEALEPAEGCSSWGRESSWTGCRCWRGTAGGGSFGAGTEAAVAEEEVEGLVEAMTEE